VSGERLEVKETSCEYSITVKKTPAARISEEP
jgi:hypothetical protein